MLQTEYKCPECGWVGKESEMEADFTGGSVDEMWSNWICPKCKVWWSLEDYIKLEERLGTVESWPKL